MFGRRRDMFRDVGPELTDAERNRAIRTAGILARQAQQTLTLTTRKQYRRYRADAGECFMCWDQWHVHYRKAYVGPPLSLGGGGPTRTSGAGNTY